MSRIDDAYYAHFKKKAKTNDKIERVPTKEELEAAGCDISGMGYLVAPDEMQYNPSAVNPVILTEDVQGLFYEGGRKPVPVPATLKMPAICHRRPLSQSRSHSQERKRARCAKKSNRWRSSTKIQTLETATKGSAKHVKKPRRRRMHLPKRKSQRLQLQPLPNRRL